MGGVPRLRSDWLPHLPIKNASNLLVPLDLPLGGTPIYTAVRNIENLWPPPMRFGVFLILFVMLVVGVAPSKAWAHEGDAAQIASAQGLPVLVHVTSPGDIGSDTVGTMPDGREDAALGIPAGHHDDRPSGLDCLTVASCGGASGIIADWHNIPLSQQTVPVSLDTAGSPPRSVDLPLEDQPPRAI